MAWSALLHNPREEIVSPGGEWAFDRLGTSDRNPFGMCSLGGQSQPQAL